MAMGYPQGMGTGFPQQQATPDDIFARIADAQATSSGNWMKDGQYVLAIKNCKYDKLYGGQTWVTEFIVIDAQPIAGALEAGGDPVAAGTAGAVQVVPNAVGTQVSFVQAVDNPQQPNGPGKVKEFLLALTNTNESAFNAEEQAAKNKRFLELAQAAEFERQGNLQQASTIRSQLTRSPFAASCAYMVGEAQPMRGALIRCTTMRKANQGRSNAANKGKILVLPKWQYLANTPAELQQRRALIEQGAPIPWPPPGAPAAPLVVPTNVPGGPITYGPQ